MVLQGGRRSTKIVMLGSGAMGSLFGGLLTEAGQDVTLFDVWKQHIDTMNQKGLRIRGKSGDRIVRVKATSNQQGIGIADLIIVFVKSYDTEEAVKNADQLISDKTTLLTLQNGLGNPERIAQITGKNNVVGGTTLQGSTLIGPGEIFHSGIGLTIIGEVDGRITERLKNINEVFNKSNIPTKMTETLSREIWRKLLVNLAVGALGALTRMTEGELLELPEVRQVMAEAAHEAVQVAERAGVRLDVDDPFRPAEEDCKNMPEGKTSVLQDIEHSRRTEIDVLNGAVVRIGKSVGVSTPVNEVLTAAVKGLERTTLRSRKA